MSFIRHKPAINRTILKNFLVNAQIFLCYRFVILRFTRCLLTVEHQTIYIPFFTKRGGLRLGLPDTFYCSACTSERSCICLVGCIGFASFNEYLVGFWNCSDNVVFFCFSIRLLNCSDNVVFFVFPFILSL